MEFVFNSLENGIWEFDSNGKTLFVNDWLCDYLGYSKEEFLTLNPIEELKKSLDEKYSGQSVYEYFTSLSPWLKHRFLTKKNRVTFLSLKVAIKAAEIHQGSFLLLCSTRYLQDTMSLHFETLQSMGSIGIWELDPITDQTFWSKEVYKIHALEEGVPTDKINGISFYAPEDQPLIAKDVEQAKAGIPYHRIYRFFDAKGNQKWVETTGRSLFDEKGKVKKLFGTIQDVTEKIEREQNLSLVLNNISEGYWDWHVDKDYEYMSNRFWEILGYDPVTKKPHPSEWQKLLHPDDAPRLFAAFDAHVQSNGKQPFAVEVRYRHGLGHWIWIRCSGKVVEWIEPTKPKRVVGTHIDVTESVIREKNISYLAELRLKLIESQGDKKKIFDYILSLLVKTFESEYGFIGEILKDSDGSPYLRTLAITDISWDINSKKFFETHAASGIEFRNLNTLFGEVIKTGKPLVTNDPTHHPKRGGTPPGHPPLKAFMGVPIYYHNEFIAMVGLANRPDGYHEKLISDYKVLFDAIGEMMNTVKLNAELESQRRYALHNAKLASIGEMAAGVGHEINNPLAIILGHLTMLKKHALQNYPNDRIIPERIEKSKKAVDRIAHIVQGLRTFARSDSGENSLFNFSELALETHQMLHEIYRSENLEFNAEITPNLWIYGNRGRWQQVMVNLLNNAKDAVQTVNLKKVELKLFAENGFIYLVVKDSGIGIPDQTKEKIFEPFFTTKEVGKGTGIGLALVNSIIQEHNATLKVTSQVGAGSEFKIEIPMSESAPITNVVTEAKPNPRESTSFMPRVHILVVDDEEDLREAWEDILKSFGCQVTVTSDGARAFDLLKTRPDQFQIIFSDMKMPHLDGPDFLEKVKTELDYKGLFFFITGGVNFDVKPFEAKVDGFLAKPVEAEEIQKLILSRIKK
jgi:signal transduction histidine kinase/PAS domain-containing protein/CheY-like chemotaxis protein